MLPSYSKVVVIGAGPSGSVASALLNALGHQVVVLEKSDFPRFSIGESLLPQSMQFLEQANLLESVQQAGFQYKDGAAFVMGQTRGVFQFEDKFTPGWGTTFQVERSRFDQVLADTAAEQGVEMHYGCEVVHIERNAATHQSVLTVVQADGTSTQVETEFVLDASGFGRVLPRLLDLDTPSDFPVRHSLFVHMEDHISDDTFDRDKILIAVHPQCRDTWFWLIPLSDKKCSFGVVGKAAFFEQFDGNDTEVLTQIIATTEPLNVLLRQAEFLFAPRKLSGYSCNVTSLHGAGFALLGNAGEFLDPVFSSGVTIAVKSASLAVDVLNRQLMGERVDWESEYAMPLMQGVDTFRCFVEAWYDGRLQDIIFTDNQNPDIKRMVCSILAGYAWDMENPYVSDPKRRIHVLANLCRKD